MVDELEISDDPVTHDSILILFGIKCKYALIPNYSDSIFDTVRVRFGVGSHSKYLTINIILLYLKYE